MKLFTLTKLGRVVAVAVAVLCAVCWVGCGGDDNPSTNNNSGGNNTGGGTTSTTYLVTVSSTGAGATGGGSYAAGATVTIKAGTPPDGQRFTRWTTESSGVSFSNATNATTTFAMPTNDVTVSANFEPIPVNTVTVLSDGAGASSGGSYAAGATVTISAGTPPDLYRFKNWTTDNFGVSFNKATDATTTFVMPTSEVTVTAVFEEYMFIDGRDGQRYKMVRIGANTWMGQNLNYQPSAGNSSCYGNTNSSCDTYGRLYDWNTAKTACPTGWRLPDTADWNRLVIVAGGTVAGKALKAVVGWNNNGNGTDTKEFSALPGGSQYPDGSFFNKGISGRWWTATVYGSGSAYARRMDSADGVVQDILDRNYGNSVRCLRE